MTRHLANPVAVVALAVGALVFAAILAQNHADAEDKPAKTPTSHYVDPAKHVELDVPLTWERKFPETEDERVRFIFATGGKSSPSAQPPEFLMVTSAKDETPKDLTAYADAVKKQAATDAENVKLDAQKEKTVDGEKAIT